MNTQAAGYMTSNRLTPYHETNHGSTRENALGQDPDKRTTLPGGATRPRCRRSGCRGGDGRFLRGCGELRLRKNSYVWLAVDAPAAPAHTHGALLWRKLRGSSRSPRPWRVDSRGYRAGAGRRAPFRARSLSTRYASRRRAHRARVDACRAAASRTGRRFGWGRAGDHARPFAGARGPATRLSSCAW